PPRPPRHLSFHPSGDTRAPPPFPTRRSSDLQPLAHGLPHRPRHVVMDVDVAPAPGHVRDVDPPAVQPRVQPAARDRVLVLVQAPAQALVAVVELREGLEPEPGLVAALVVEQIEAALLAALARGAEPF